MNTRCSNTICYCFLAAGPRKRYTPHFYFKEILQFSFKQITKNFERRRAIFIALATIDLPSGPYPVRGDKIYLPRSSVFVWIFKRSKTIKNLCIKKYNTCMHLRIKYKTHEKIRESLRQRSKNGIYSSLAECSLQKIKCGKKAGKFACCVRGYSALNGMPLDK